MNQLKSSYVETLFRGKIGRAAGPVIGRTSNALGARNDIDNKSDHQPLTSKQADTDNEQL